MSDKSSSARFLHPRLRVIANGDNDVNCLRSQISTRVISARPPANKEGLADETYLATTQRNICQQGPDDQNDQKSLTPAKSDDRKGADENAADDCFINVIIDAQVTDDFGQQGGTNQATTAIADKISKRLADYPGEIPGAGVTQHQNMVTATVPVSMLQELAADDHVSFVHPAEPLKLDIPNSSPATATDNSNIPSEDTHQDGRNVIIGIIDVGGYDFAHEDFLDENGETRFLRIWDQKDGLRPPPEDFANGSEITRDHMNAAIRQERDGGMPATMLERQSQEQPASHATHVASIAAGNNGLCPKADIAAVLIDIPHIEDDNERRRFTFTDSSRIIEAVEYLNRVAKAEGKPISINISLGTNGGSHDGSSGTNRALDLKTTLPGRCITVAAGNSGQEKGESENDYGWIMGRIHSSGRIASRGLDAEIHWTVVGNGIADISENELEIWYSPQDRFTCELLPPGETEWIRVEPQEYVENVQLTDGTFVSIYNELYHPTNGSNYIALYLSPKLRTGDIRGVRSGIWRVRLIGEEIRDGRYHCWIERDDPHEINHPHSQRLFRFPSFFTEDSNVDSHSISSLACGNGVIAVANYDARSNKMNISSSQGPTRDHRFKPDIAAPGTEIIAANGFAKDGSIWTAMTGTSMASPYVAGVIGLMLDTNGDLNAAQCLGILQRTATPMPGNSYEWVNDSGFGRINPQAAIKEAKGFTNRKDVKPTGEVQ